MKFRKSFLFLLLSILLIWSVTSCKKEPTEIAKVSLRLAWLPGATFAGDYVAKNEGYWDAEEIDVTINPGGFNLDPIKLVASNSDQFGVTKASNLLYARERGVPIVVIAAIIVRSPIAWISLKDSEINRPEDFIGKKVGEQYGTGTDVTLEALFEKLGLDLSEIQRIPMQFNYAPFLSGEYDVVPCYLIDQVVEFQAKGIELNIIDPYDYDVSLYYPNVYFTTEKMIKEKPELVQKFLNGALKGWEKSFESPELTIDSVMVDIKELNREIEILKLKSQIKIMRSENEEIPFGKMEDEKWQTIIDILEKYGELKLGISLKDIFTNEFVEEFIK